MIAFSNKHFSSKLITILIATVFMLVTLVCFSAATGGMHTGHVNSVCETVMSLTDETIVQVSTVFLLLLMVIGLVRDTSFFKAFVGTQNGLQVCYTSPPEIRIVPQEYSYLRLLFSSGIIHTKVYSYTA